MSYRLGKMLFAFNESPEAMINILSIIRTQPDPKCIIPYLILPPKGNSLLEN